MCEEAIIYRPDGSTVYAENIVELRAAIYPHKVVMLRCFNGLLPENHCLCSVNFESTAEGAKMTATPPDWTESWGYWMLKPETTNG